MVTMRICLVVFYSLFTTFIFAAEPGSVEIYFYEMEDMAAVKQIKPMLERQKKTMAEKTKGLSWRERMEVQTSLRFEHGDELFNLLSQKGKVEFMHSTDLDGKKEVSEETEWGTKKVSMSYIFGSSFDRPCIKFNIQRNGQVWAMGGCWWYELGKAHQLHASGPYFLKNNTEARYFAMFMKIMP